MSASMSKVLSTELPLVVKLKRQLRYYSEQEKRDHYDAWKRSSLSQSKYCQEVGLSVTTFWSWTQREQKSPQLKKFIAVKPVNSPTERIESSEIMELSLASGIRLRLKRPGQLSELTALIKSLNQE